MTFSEEALLKAFQRLTRREALSVQLDLSRKPSLTDSKFGGLPYWDLQKEYPQTSEGNKLALLAQFNLDELNREGKNVGGQLPKSGMLQIFIDVLNDDYVYGMEMTAYDPEKGVDFHREADGKLLQNGFRVVYHPQIDPAVTAEAVKSIGMPVVSDDTELYSPLDAEYAVRLEPKTCYMTPWDMHFDQMMLQAAKEVGVQLQEDRDVYDQLSDTLQSRLVEMNGLEDDGFGHWMLGYPSFTQADDPRGYQEDLARFDVQLFQMDSEYRKEENVEIMWGDMGVANFFIPSENLKNCDFSDILYSWDCT